MRPTLILALAALLGVAVLPLALDEARAWGTWECGTLGDPYPLCCPDVIFWGPHGNTVCVPDVPRP